LKKTLGATCASALLMACSSMHTSTIAPTPEPGVVTALEQACLQDPLDASKWERLAAALADRGERERATVMYLQASTLRTHDVHADYTLLRNNVVDAHAEVAAIESTMPRTEVRQVGAAMVQVMRLPAVHATVGGSDAELATKAGAVSTLQAIVRLEISNGNGVNGAAAKLAHSLDVEGLKTVRLTNMRSFNVPFSRIEYQSGQMALAQTLGRRLSLPLHTLRGNAAYADVRIVLGRDTSQATYLK